MHSAVKFFTKVNRPAVVPYEINFKVIVGAVTAVSDAIVSIWNFCAAIAVHKMGGSSRKC